MTEVKMIKAILVLVLASGQALAGEIASERMDVVDFLVDRNGLIGKRVVVAGCYVVAAYVDHIQCRPPVGGSTFYVDGKTLDREGLRRALRNCAKYDVSKACEAEISGVVVSRVLAPNDPGLSQATVRWVQP